MTEPSISSQLPTLLSSLEIPQEYGERDISEAEAKVISKLDAWKENTSRVLDNLKDLVKQAKREGLTSEESAHVIAATAPFDGQGPWIDSQTKTLADGTKLCYRSEHSYDYSHRDPGGISRT